MEEEDNNIGVGDVEIEELLDRRISRVGPHERVN